MSLHHLLVDTVSLLQGGVQLLQLCRVHREGAGDFLVKVLVNGVMKVTRVLAPVIVHEELFGQDVPGSVSMKVLVSLHQLSDNVDVNTWMEVFQFLSQSMSSLKHC